MNTKHPPLDSALCPHFGECGGCTTQDRPYPEQLAAKEAFLQGLFCAYWEQPISVTPSPRIRHYRNKVDPSFAPMHYPEPPPPGFLRETVLGFKRRGCWYWPLEIQTCLIGPEGLEPLLAAVRAWMRATGLPAFDSRTGRGFLRCLLVRDAKRTGERMVALITRPGAFDAASFVAAVRGAFPDASIFHGVSEGTADGSFAEQVTLLEGAPHITEVMHVPDPVGPRLLRFQISPMSFFQTNPLAAEQLYGMIREWVRRVAPELIYDLYGGAGGIAFSCADLTAEVHSVENLPAASEDGRRNAALNGIGNVTFHTEAVKNFLRNRLEEYGLGRRAAVVVDPPRSGMEGKALRRLVALAPPHLFYVSCNPKALAAEMPVLMEHYLLESLRAVDHFPHTPHVEVAAIFRHRSAK